MASGMFGVGTSGLLTAQRQLNTTSHNISNVNTEGYSRQRAEQAARTPQFAGNGYIGTGVDVQTTVRLANEFLEDEIRDANSQFGKFEAFHELASQIDDILANPDSGLTPTLESFFSAFQEVNDNPSSTPARQVLLTEANTMAERFKLLDDRFIRLNNRVNQQLVDLTNEASDTARSIARLNADIVQKIGAGQGLDVPNDLIDLRETLIKKISENIDVNVIYQDDGSVNLFIGSGQSLVIGATAASMTTQQNRYNALDLDVMLLQGSGSINITNQITGGELEGALDFKFDVLEPSRRALGRVALAVTEELNHQHHLGMTLQDSGGSFPLGQDFFTDLSGAGTAAPIVAQPGQTPSTGDYRIEINNSRVLSTSDYQLDFTAGAFTLTKLSDRNVSYAAATIADLNTAMSATEGFSLVETNPAALDESFLIRPTFTASANMDVSVNNVLDIALAAPIIAEQVTNADGSATNSGTGSISLPVVNTTQDVLTDIPPALPINLQYNTLSLQFDVTNLPATSTVSFIDNVGVLSTLVPPIASIPYDPIVDFSGVTYTVNYASGDSFSFEIEGVPQVGDQFEIKTNTTPYDDNRNGLRMAQLQTTKTLENSSTDFQAGYGIIVSEVGSQTHSAEIDLLAQQTLSEQAKANRGSYSGVNLDEEAAELLKYQQAYQAAARVISIADEMFQTLLSSV